MKDIVHFDETLVTFAASIRALEAAEKTWFDKLTPAAFQKMKEAEHKYHQARSSILYAAERLAMAVA